jgi:acetoin utilization deacetylase AcuC-like enzyme
VLYISIHQWPLYPGTGPADYEGEGPGEGYTVNLPVPPGSGSDEFLALVQHVVVPVARTYEPGLIAISAGYDAHRDDPLASCRLETQAYGDMAATIRDLGAELDAPVLISLEGGYAPDALAASVVRTIDALNGDRPPVSAPAEPAAPHLERVRRRWDV